MKVRDSMLVVAAAVLLGTSCSRPDPDRGASPPANAVEGDSAAVARLEREARALAHAEGCSGQQECHTAGLGERPCGGPREYLVYCARTTDTAALHRKLAELRQAETELNRRTGAMSTCEFREPPATRLVGGSCRAAPR